MLVIISKVIIRTVR